MPDITLTVPRLDDASIVRLFRDIATQFKPFDCSASLIAINVTINLNANQPSQLLELVTKQNSFALHSAHASFRQLILRWWRGGENKNNPWFDEVKFQRVEQQNQGPEFSDVERLELINFVNERLGPSVPPPQPGAIGLNDVEALYRSTILKLETSFAQQLERLTSWSVEQAGEFERLKLELAEQTQHEREKLQAERDEMTVSQKAAADELEQRKKTLDDRDYMHARRGIRSDLQKIIASREEKFGLTKNTRTLRLPIHLAMCTLIVLLVYMNVSYYRLFGELDVSHSAIAVIIMALVRQGAVAIALIGAILYYVRWMNRWFEEHSQAEFRLKQFQLDVDRASWVVETALEWRRAEKSEIPVP